MVKERVEQKIVEQIKNSMISIPVKELLEHPGILYQMRGALMTKGNQENKVAMEWSSLEVNSHGVKVMVDTGAEVNLISLDLAKLVRLEKRIERVKEGLYNADKSPMKVKGKLLGIRSKVLNKVRPLIFYVSPCISHDLILGRPFEKTFEMRYTSEKNMSLVEMLDENERWIKVPSAENEGGGILGTLSCVCFEKDEHSQTMEILQADKENVMITSLMIKSKGSIKAKLESEQKKEINTVRKRVADKIKPV
ncbi:hypothetical protein HMI54_002108 [Coelomomyces lativittatus]|nr:hypothetical protein HMI54_002108 [Coelomomyces lativittatus]